MTDKKKINATGSGGKVLIPVDFSPRGALALRVGFELARRLGKEVDLIHASIIANPMIEPQFPDDFNGLDNENAELEEIELEKEVHTIDESSMDKLRRKIEKLQQTGDFPSIKFDTIIAPGMPEEVMAEYCAVTPPAVIVMATRGVEKRREELVGSVTAEVIDKGIAPVLTVPSDYSFAGFKQIVRICALCHFDGGDVEAVDALMKMFDNPEVKIYLFPATDKLKHEEAVGGLNNLQSKLSEQYPSAEFVACDIQKGKNLREEAERFFIANDIQMILAPNRKRNAISRFFKPGLAHKILFEIDFPLLAIPT